MTKEKVGFFFPFIFIIIIIFLNKKVEVWNRKLIDPNFPPYPMPSTPKINFESFSAKLKESSW